MNPNSASTNQNNSLFNNAFETKEFEQTEPEPTSVTHTDSDKQAIKDSWSEFYSLKTEEIHTYTPENAVNRTEITETKVEYQFTEAPKIFQLQEEKAAPAAEIVIEKQKGSGNWVEDAGLKLDFKGLFSFVFGGLGKNLGGALGVMFEISKDAVKAATRTEKKAEDPTHASDGGKKAEAKKKADAKKKGNIRAFYDGLRAQAGPVASIEAIQAEAQEKENINKTVKLNTSYKGIKDSFGRITKYAASMFEKAQMEQEKQVKKIEQQQKSAATKGPDLNLDKAAEGGFLSSTGGQGAG